jgi:hypothetical protein
MLRYQEIVFLLPVVLGEFGKRPLFVGARPGFHEFDTVAGADFA